MRTLSSLPGAAWLQFERGGGKYCVTKGTDQSHTTKQRRVSGRHEWWGRREGRPTSGRGRARGAVRHLQVLQQLHGLAGHYDLLQDGPEEGHHGVLPAGPPVTARTRTSAITHFFFIFRLFGYTVQCVSGIPKVSVIYRNIFVSMEIEKNIKP